MVTLLDSLIDLIPIAFGFALGFLVKPIVDWFGKRSRRKRLAIILSSEVEAIKASAKRSIEINSPSVEQARKNLQQGPKLLGGIEIADVDFPSKVYEEMLVDIGLFSTDLVILITELYRWVEYAHHHKRENLKIGSDLDSLIKTLSGRSLTEQERIYRKVRP